MPISQNQSLQNNKMSSVDLPGLNTEYRNGSPWKEKASPRKKHQKALYVESTQYEWEQTIIGTLNFFQGIRILILFRKVMPINLDIIKWPKITKCGLE